MFQGLQIQSSSLDDQTSLLQQFFMQKIFIIYHWAIPYHNRDRCCLLSFFMLSLYYWEHIQRCGTPIE